MTTTTLTPPTVLSAEPAATARHSGAGTQLQRQALADPVGTPGGASDTRQRLVEAATNLFWEKGYAATGLSEILKEAGARAGSLYHFFPTKEQLLLAVLDQHKVILETVILRAGDHEIDPVRRVQAIVGFYRQFMERTGCALGCPIGNLAAEIADTYPAARERVASLFEVFRAGVRDALTAGRTGMAPGPADEMASVIVSLLQGALTQSRATRSVAPLDACRVCIDRMLTSAA